MTTLRAESVDSVPESRSSEGRNAQLIREFVDSDDNVRLVQPERVYKDEKKRRKQVASAYNTLKYHIKRLGLQERVRAMVRNWDVYLAKIEAEATD
jgi:hypothetical protein